MNNNEPTPAKRLDPTAFRASVALIGGLALLLATLAVSAIADLGWLSWLLARGWLVTLATLIISLLALSLFDLTRLKNVTWRALAQQFREEFGESFEQKNFGTGRGRVGDDSYFGLRCFGSPGGIEIRRIASFVNPSIYLPWSAIAKIDTFPNLLTGRKDFETDMQAQINLRNHSELTLEVPWLSEYRQLLPKSVKYRSIKLSKK